MTAKGGSQMNLASIGAEAWVLQMICVWVSLNSIALVDAGSIADQVSTLAGRGHNVQLVASGE